MSVSTARLAGGVALAMTVVAFVGVVVAKSIARPAFEVVCPDGLSLTASSVHPHDGMLRAKGPSGNWWTLPPTCTARPLGASK